MRIISIYIILQIILFDLQTDYKLTGVLKIQGDQYYSDPMGNIYIIQDNRIRKYNNMLEKLADYTNVYLGNITSVDVSDPLRILVFYKDFNQILWLDNFLLELRSPVRLDDLYIDQAELVCSSSQGGFWIYNSLKKQIQYLDSDLKLIHESINLQPLTGENIPCSMIEKSSIVYLNVPNTGILTFDRFGTYNQTLPVYPDKRFQVTNENIFYTSYHSFYTFNLSSFTHTKLELPDTADLQFVMTQQRILYLVQKDRIKIYESVNSPFF
jgi:hypothetical protein